MSWTANIRARPEPRRVTQYLACGFEKVEVTTNCWWRERYIFGVSGESNRCEL